VIHISSNSTLLTSSENVIWDHIRKCGSQRWHRNNTTLYIYIYYFFTTLFFVSQSVTCVTCVSFGTFSSMKLGGLKYSCKMRVLRREMINWREGSSAGMNYDETFYLLIICGHVLIISIQKQKKYSNTEFSKIKITFKFSISKMFSSLVSRRRR